MPAPPWVLAALPTAHLPCSKSKEYKCLRQAGQMTSGKDGRAWLRVAQEAGSLPSVELRLWSRSWQPLSRCHTCLWEKMRGLTPPEICELLASMVLHQVNNSQRIPTHTCHRSYTAEVLHIAVQHSATRSLFRKGWHYWASGKDWKQPPAAENRAWQGRSWQQRAKSRSWRVLLLARKPRVGNWGEWQWGV